MIRIGVIAPEKPSPAIIYIISDASITTKRTRGTEKVNKSFVDLYSLSLYSSIFPSAYNEVIRGIITPVKAENKDIQIK